MLYNRVVIGTRCLMYKKSMNFPLMRNQEHSTGNIMNYMLVDIENIGRVYSMLPMFVQFPFMLLGGIVMIYNVVGLAFIGGICSIAITYTVISKLSTLVFE